MTLTIDPGAEITKFLIREIRPSEYPFLQEMLQQAIYFPDPNKKEEKLTELRPILSTFFDGFGREGDIAFVAEHNDRLIGAVWTRIFSKQKDAFGYVDDETPELSIAVKHRWRSRGVGAALITRLIDNLADAGFKKVSLCVDKRNRSVNLYRRLGFEVVSEGETAYTMLRQLSPQD